MSDQGGDNPTYTYRPSLMGATWSFTVADDALHWDSGRRAGRIGYDAIRRVRLSYRPGSMQPHRFMTEIWSEGTPKLTVISVTWKGMADVARLDREYRAFVLALHRHLAKVGRPIELIGGSHPVMFWTGTAVFGGAAIAVAAMLLRALQQGADIAALLIGAFFVLFFWQAWNFFHRNRPVRYAATGVPEVLLPKGR